MGIQVLIVGAGPSGLALALFLKKQGINLRIVDKNSGPGTASRAIIIHARTLEFYRQIGLADEIVRKGIKVDCANLYKDGNVIISLKLGDIGADLSPYPFLLSFSQDDHEQYLTQQLAALGVHVEWDTELVKVKNTDEGVDASLKTVNGIEICQCRYLCGCDGAHSIVRQQLGIDFPGGTYDEKFYVADVDVVQKETKQGVNLCFDNNNFCVLMPVRQSGTHRLIGIMLPDGNSFDDVKMSSEAHLNVKMRTVNWFSIYRVHHRVANSFRVKSAFLLGDAGHIHSPTGGQGMNTGIGDAVNLAWKLAAVLHKKASEKLLDTYELERIKFARKLVKTTDRLFQFMTGKSFFNQFCRRFLFVPLFSVVTRFQRVRQVAFYTVSQIGLNYRHKKFLICEKSVQEGDRLPWVTFKDGDNFLSLQNLNWQLHIYGLAQDQLYDISTSRGFVLNVFPWNEQAQKRGLKKDTLYLIRPDGYVAFISRDQDIKNLDFYLNKEGIKTFIAKA